MAIDGLRAWMAWLVVVTHAMQQGLQNSGGAIWLRLDLGGHAVDTFIIISGFVITHLLTGRPPSSYLGYLVPRFMRLFPAFLVCSVIGGLAYWAAEQWSGAGWFEENHAFMFDTMVEHLPAHIAAHLLMLHGLLPNTVLPFSEYVFLSPGWSVSLEWQFYLVAPLVVRMCTTRNGALALVAGVMVLAMSYHFSLAPLWDRPSVLAGTAKFFLIGIACRFAAPGLAGSVRHGAATSLGVGFTFLWLGSLSLALWSAVFCFMLRDGTPSRGVDRAFVSAMRLVLESRPALWLADRSYSTYLLHWPVLMLIGTVATAHGMVIGPALFGVMLLALPLTLVLQEPIYRWVEVPGRALGRQWAVRLGDRPVNKVEAEKVRPEPLRSMRAAGPA